MQRGGWGGERRERPKNRSEIDQITALTLLRAQLRRIHRLAHCLENEFLGLLERDFVLVILFEKGGRRGVVCADTRGLPARVVARRIGLIQLETVERVVADVEKGDAEGAETWGRQQGSGAKKGNAKTRASGDEGRKSEGGRRKKGDERWSERERPIEEQG